MPVATVRALMNGLIDYAGLFPPASLDMADAAENYASYLEGPQAWMLGRLIVPANRMEEFESAATPLLKKKAWRIGILGLPGRGFTHPKLAVDSIELKPELPADIQPLAAHVPVYFEIPSSPGMHAHIDAIRHASARAKIRTGGLTAESIPSGAAIMRFLVLCSQAKIAFKATAGLHHAIQGIYALSGEARGAMHGFLNLFLAAAFLHSGANEDEAGHVLAEPSARAFRFDDQVVHWNSLHLTLPQLESARRNFAISFGSCSFLEPVQELAAIGLL